MPIPVKCSCNASYSLKDEYAGKSLRCLECGAPLNVGQPAIRLVANLVANGHSAANGATAVAVAPDMAPSVTGAVTDPVFGRDKFLLKRGIL